MISTPIDPEKADTEVLKSSDPHQDEASDVRDGPETGNRLDDLVGIFAQEPLWDDLMAEVRAHREKQNAAESGKD